MSIIGLLMVFCGAAMAGLGGAVKVGSLGYGGELTTDVSQKFNLRLGMNVFNMDLDFSKTDGDGSSDDIKVGIDFQTFCGLFDWHPEGGGLRLTAGVILNNNEVNMTADMSDAVEINNIKYSISDFRGHADFMKFSPYLGFGWGNAVDKAGRWTFALDVGVMLQGSPDVSITATASDPRLQAELDSNIQNEIDKQNDNLKLLSVWPVISFGVGYRFF